VKQTPIVLDSSAWIEILGLGPLSKACQKELTSASEVIVPTVVFFEVYRKIASSLSEDQALSATAILSQYAVSDLTKDIALTAADLSREHKLAMADSLVLAHATVATATLVTLDNDFSGLPSARVLRK
jgi:predicted nucleic acid-binding protein